ncbi:MAG: alkylhydroperoxidase [Martelella sp.]|uniref:peroxidase-related enzyme n=1 Tax=unclassified Martelella TaxID=2629616 RepID=UPI000C622032|nr:peroxidase-related enzyme [Martelella sp.]MAU22290.1 alkylhydroperoxidase [Martelella sp.]
MSVIVKKFTRTIPDWQPRVVPVDIETATEAQREALQITPSNAGISPYVLTLAHDVETLKVRSPLFNAIMYGKDGLSRAERELGAISASVVNGCIYCAAVHATRHAQLEKSTEVTDQLLMAGPDAELSPRNRAIFDFAAALSACPPKADAAQLDALRAAGLSEIEIVDLVLSAALFGWANRLMHVLGDPVRRQA